MIKRKSYIAELDYQILIIFIILSIVGLMMQLDISQERRLTMFYKQSLWSVISLIALFTILFVKIEYIRKTLPFWLGLSALLLITVLIVPHKAKGAGRSLRIGPVSFQPSLLGRIVLILFVADRLDKKSLKIAYLSVKDFIIEFKWMLGTIVAFYILVYMEKHLSILIIFSLVLFTMLLLANIKMKTLGVLTASVLLFLIISLPLLSKLKHDSDTSYRGRRLKVYTQYSLIPRVLGIKPSKIKTHEKMQIRESLIALSSGGLFGLGTGKSIAKNYYLPESRTDYIFGIIGEEYGFLGALLILLLYGWFFYRVFKLYLRLNDNFLKLVTIGLGLNLFYNALVNIGVNISALPSTGVTLPFISYGGTSFLMNAIAVGILLNISMKWSGR